MKNRNLFYLIIVVSIITGVWSGIGIYKKIKLHLYGDSLEINPLAVDAQTKSIKAVSVPEPVEDKKEQDIKVEEKLPDKEIVQDKAAVEQEGKIKAVKVLFKYKNKKAKKVYLSGSFLKWKEKPMKNKNGEWQREEYILPGNYFYHFVVDGKKTLDPAATKTPMGESLVAVK